MIEVLPVAPLRTEVAVGRKLAASIIAALPRQRSDLLPADQLALCVLLQECTSMSITKIGEALGLPISTAIEMIDRAEESGRVERDKVPAQKRPTKRAERHAWHHMHDDARCIVVRLTAKAKRERRRARGAERLGL